MIIDDTLYIQVQRTTHLRDNHWHIPLEWFVGRSVVRVVLEVMGEGLWYSVHIYDVNACPRTKNARPYPLKNVTDVSLFLR